MDARTLGHRAVLVALGICQGHLCPRQPFAQLRGGQRAIVGADVELDCGYVDGVKLKQRSGVGGAFAFAISMGEFGATTFIARPATPTIPIAIFRYLGRPGAAPFGAALALSVVLMVVTAAVIVAIDSLGSDKESGL